MIKNFSIFILALAVPFAVHAASLNVVSSRSSVNVGELVKVDVALDTQGEAVNAIQGTITFPQDVFSFAGVEDGASPVLFWIQAPQETASGTVSFAGIMPGGFEGNASSVVSILLNPVSGGTGVVSINDAQVLRNDGQGSPVPLTTSDWAFIVGGTSGASTSPSGMLTLPTRFTIPENFIPIVSRDSNVYGGKYFLAFSTVDNGSGISHYNVAEVPVGSALGQNIPWTAAVSPYLLRDQTLASDIYVQAVNNAGASVIVKLPAEHPVARHNIWTSIIVGILIAGGICGIVLSARFFRRRKKRKGK